MPKAVYRLASLLAIVGILAVMTGCSQKHSAQAEKRRACLTADVSATDDAVSVKNSGNAPWSNVEITLLNGPDDAQSFKFSYRRAALLCSAIINVDMNRFTRADGLAYVPGKYKLQGIRITTDDPFAIFNTAAPMERDSDGTYENECKSDF